MFSVRELLPKEYAKAKEHEKNIAEEYKEIIYEDQVAPKKKYCELCQSLPTYGVTFFLVKGKCSVKISSFWFVFRESTGKEPPDSAFVGRQQRVGDARRRKVQVSVEGMAVGASQTMGGSTEDIHVGKFLG